MIFSKLALGTVQFGLDYGAKQAGKVQPVEVKKILGVCRKKGINTLDTAITYGNSEEILGNIGIDGFNVVTKLPALPEDNKNVVAWVSQQVSESLVRLGKKSYMVCSCIVLKICWGRIVIYLYKL